ncbi:hypothetical protein OBBRIDRAFT_774086 [Obba rivulosa]|uniref:Uncharacterized protein n=1 Tax=Obba rivulosa TaxID=1052685 RepID=A0A8E2AXA6_9APHY|nr:hypothetical protein OBBRIDRAFT_774086 [Obba rivulosa]
MARSSTKTPSTPGLITYRFKQAMAYVKPAENHDEAAEYAKEVFGELNDTPSNRISFSITVRVQDKIQTVTITPRAWRDTMGSLAKFEIVDISVTEPRPSRPASIVIDSPHDAPPQYSSRSEKEADMYQDEKYLTSDYSPKTRSRSPSPSPSSRNPISRGLDLLQRLSGAS